MIGKELLVKILRKPAARVFLNWTPVILLVVAAIVETSNAAFGLPSPLGDLSNAGARFFWILSAALAFAMLSVIHENTRQSPHAYEFIDDGNEAYKRMKEAVKTARRVLRTTHLRNTPLQNIPDPMSREYQLEVHKWVSGDEARSARRVVSTNPHGMAVHSLYMLSIATALPKGRYKVFGIDWSLSIPAVNLAIIDEREAFICSYDRSENQSGLGKQTPPRLRAIRTTDPKCVAAWIAYFEALTEDSATTTDSNLIAKLSGQFGALSIDDRRQAWKTIQSDLAALNQSLTPNHHLSVAAEFSRAFPNP